MSLRKAVVENELVWCEFHGNGTSRTRKLGVVVDPGWLVRDTDSAKLVHENAWIEVAVGGKILTMWPPNVHKTSLLEKLAFAAK